MRAVSQARNRVSWGDGVMTKPEFISAELGTRVTAHALHIGDRINTMGFEDEALGGSARDPGWQGWRRRPVSLRGRGTDRPFTARRKRLPGKADAPDRWEARALRGGNRDRCAHQ